MLPGCMGVSVPVKGSFVVNEEMHVVKHNLRLVSVPVKGSFVVNMNYKQQSF